MPQSEIVIQKSCGTYLKIIAPPCIAEWTGQGTQFWSSWNGPTLLLGVFLVGKRSELAQVYPATVFDFFSHFLVYFFLHWDFSVSFLCSKQGNFFVAVVFCQKLFISISTQLKSWEWNSRQIKIKTSVLASTTRESGTKKVWEALSLIWVCILLLGRPQPISQLVLGFFCPGAQTISSGKKIFSNPWNIIQ